MTTDTTADELLRSLQKEVVKTKSVYDGSNRLITRYEAFSNSPNGKPCLKTTYTYVGATTNIDKTKEELATWNSAWD